MDDYVVGDEVVDPVNGDVVDPLLPRWFDAFDLLPDDPRSPGRRLQIEALDGRRDAAVSDAGLPSTRSVEVPGINPGLSSESAN
jgi:hypothetical protein